MARNVLGLRPGLHSAMLQATEDDGDNVEFHEPGDEEATDSAPPGLFGRSLGQASASRWITLRPNYKSIGQEAISKVGADCLLPRVIDVVREISAAEQGSHREKNWALWEHREEHISLLHSVSSVYVSRQHGHSYWRKAALVVKHCWRKHDMITTIEAVEHLIRMANSYKSQYNQNYIHNPTGVVSPFHALVESELYSCLYSFDATSSFHVAVWNMCQLCILMVLASAVGRLDQKCQTTLSNPPGNISVSLDDRAEGKQCQQYNPINAEWFRLDVPIILSPEYRQAVDVLKDHRVVNDLMVEYIRCLSQLKGLLSAQLDMASILEHKLLTFVHTLVLAAVNLCLGLLLNMQLSEGGTIEFGFGGHSSHVQEMPPPQAVGGLNATWTMTASPSVNSSSSPMFTV